MSDQKPCFVTANGVSLRCDFGGSGKTPLVLLHELGGALESWDDVIRPLRADRPVLRYDLRGAGLSEKIRGPVEFETLADDLIALCDHFGLEKVALAGCAVGGGIALAAVVMHPDRILAVAGFSPATGLPADRAQALIEESARVAEEGMQRVLDRGFQRAFPEQLRGDREAFERCKGLMLAYDPGSYAELSRMLTRSRLESQLEQIGCPVLAAAGRFDLIRPPDVVKAIAGQIPGAEFVELDCGHYAASQAPRQVLRCIAGFLADHGL